VLVRPEQRQAAEDLAVDEGGLAQLLLHERLDVHDVLRPSVEPLASVLDGGTFTPESRELLTADRLRAVLSPLVEEGNIVVVHVPDLESVDGDAFMGASDLNVVVVTTSRTRRRRIEQIVREAQERGSATVALVVGRGDLAHRSRPTRESGSKRTGTGRDVVGRDDKTRSRT